jgi:hypothetical protein
LPTVRATVNQSQPRALQRPARRSQIHTGLSPAEAGRSGTTSRSLQRQSRIS